MEPEYYPLPPSSEDDFVELPRAIARSIPSNVEAEQALLGSILLQGDTYYLLQTEPDEFYLEKHRWIFEIVQQLASTGSDIDFLTVSSALERINRLEAVGGASYLTSLLNAVPTASHAHAYAELVERASMDRSLIRASTEIAELAYGGQQIRTEDLLPMAFAKLYRLVQARGTGSKSFAELLQGYIPTLQQYRVEQREVHGIRTGFDLDLYVGGLQKQEVMLITGYPGKGKTSLGTQLGWEVAEGSRLGTLFFSLEMSAQQLMLRMSAQQTGVNTDLIRQGKTNAEQNSRLDAWAAMHADIPLFVNDSPQTLASMRLELAKLKAMGILIEEVIIDYTRLVQSNIQNEAQRITDITRGFKLLAKAEDVSVVAFHTLNRSKENKVKDEDGRAVPTLGSLAYGGEYDADVVVHLDFDDARQTQIAYMYLLKNRMGRLGRIVSVYDETLTRWGNYIAGEEPPPALTRDQTAAPPPDARWEQAVME